MLCWVSIQWVKLSLNSAWASLAEYCFHIQYQSKQRPVLHCSRLRCPRATAKVCTALSFSKKSSRCYPPTCIQNCATINSKACGVTGAYDMLYDVREMHRNCLAGISCRHYPPVRDDKITVLGQALDHLFCNAFHETGTVSLTTMCFSAWCNISVRNTRERKGSPFI